MPNIVAEVLAATAAENGALAFLIVPPRADRDWHPAGVEVSYAEGAREVVRLRMRYAVAGYGLGHRGSGKDCGRGARREVCVCGARAVRRAAPTPEEGGSWVRLGVPA
jgi:hypothetical protein